MAGPKDTVSLAIASFWTSFGVFRTNQSNEANFLQLAIVIVEAQEPVALFQVPRHRLLLGGGLQ